MITQDMLGLKSLLLSLTDIVENVFIEDVSDYCSIFSIKVRYEAGIPLTPINTDRYRINLIMLLDISRRDYTPVWNTIMRVSKDYAREYKLHLKVIQDLSKYVKHYVPLNNADLSLFYLPPNYYGPEYRPVDSPNMLIQQTQPVLTGLIKVCDNKSYFND